MKLTCFKAYDIRGKLGEELSETVAYRVGKAFAQFLSAKKVVVGADVRLTSEALKLALSAGLIDGGASVTDIGMTGTEEIYFATSDLHQDGGIQVTASHNPIDYNGMKLVREQSKPISGDTGLNEIKALAESYSEQEVQAALARHGAPSNEAAFLDGIGQVKAESLLQTGQFQKRSNLEAYTEHMLSYIEPSKLKPLKLVVNAGNGAAGHALDAIEQKLKHLGAKIEFIKVHHDADGRFPNGIPNPLLPECRASTAEAVLTNQADMGIAWDGDFDRCFLFDERGQFIEGYYIVGLLAQAFLTKHKGEAIIFDPRVYWNTEDIVKQGGGRPVKSKTGHAFIKERMRKEDAVYGGEMSAHHYFRDFAYCDSGMIPWLLVAELISTQGQTLSEMVAQRIAAFPSSGEINSTVADADVTLSKVLDRYQSQAQILDETDGIGLEFGTWRFNLRKSNTEPVIRLNVESRGDAALTKEKTEELLALIRS
ncbi:phosphomannomutase CpsG [Aliiglaciecola sp. CAU 1673]|uniref:phosphomannomutase CpsG n=1 Tax=Aliiglaciecola sp. CAU 1673 TaxID=3032595 RepID=UPI0023DBBD3C|nr:phosphomannomutase CpsG [Aliiglaciecola sp. CAU 1673]MDF2179648.1 phosphomannomutase CpsG [Aliiglaciecola sp. CAU 1673]